MERVGDSWETDESLGSWFVSKRLIQMDMAFKTRGQGQLLIKTNTTTERSSGKGRRGRQQLTRQRKSCEPQNQAGPG